MSVDLSARPAAAQQAAAWAVPRCHPSLAPTDVHLWLAAVGAAAASERPLFTLLDASERERASRFHAARDRQRFTLAHGLLRLLLGRYAGRSATQLGFGFGRYGKPHVLDLETHMNLEFNMSHAGDLVLIAVARSRAVGVDVERWDEAVDYDGVAGFCFSPSERAALAALPQADKAAAFFAVWTRKEAYIKATGCGITQGLDHFDVSPTPGAARLVCDRREVGAVERWSMRDLIPAAGYSGAVVAEGSYGLHCFSITPILEGCSTWS